MNENINPIFNNALNALQKPVRAVTITDLETLETFTRFHLSECANEHEARIFNTVKATRDTIKMGTTIGDPLF